MTSPAASQAPMISAQSRDPTQVVGPQAHYIIDLMTKPPVESHIVILAPISWHPSPASTAFLGHDCACGKLGCWGVHRAPLHLPNLVLEERCWALIPFI